MSRIPDHAFRAMASTVVQAAERSRILTALPEKDRAVYLRDEQAWLTQKASERHFEKDREQTRVRAYEVKHPFKRADVLKRRDRVNDKSQRLPAMSIHVRVEPLPAAKRSLLAAKKAVAGAFKGKPTVGRSGHVGIDTSEKAQARRRANRQARYQRAAYRAAHAAA